MTYDLTRITSGPCYKDHDGTVFFLWNAISAFEDQKGNLVLDFGTRRLTITAKEWQAFINPPRPKAGPSPFKQDPFAKDKKR